MCPGLSSLDFAEDDPGSSWGGGGRGRRGSGPGRGDGIAPQAKALGSAPATARSVKHPLHGIRFPKRVPPPVPEQDLAQSEAKQYLPPESHVWRCNTRGGWHFQVMDYSRQHENWTDHNGNSYLAMLAVMRRAWDQWLGHHDLPRSACPIAGLFDGT